MTRREILATLLPGLALLTSPKLLRGLSSRQTPTMMAHKNPGCMCCNGWADHLREHGISVTLEEHPDLASLKDELGIPTELRSCHTGTVGGYLVEGHVPAEDVLRLLDEQPDVVGIATPGMPTGSPGMEVDGVEPQAYEVIAWTKDGSQTVFAQH